MALIHWRDSYAVNVFKLDQEHKKLVGMINTLFEARRAGKDESVLRGILAELVGYTQAHFDHEEKEMARLDYPDLKAHQGLHRHLRQQVVDMKTMIDQDIEGLSEPVFKFLRHWLMDHIMEEDKKYSSYFNEAGVY